MKNRTITYTDNEFKILYKALKYDIEENGDKKGNKKKLLELLKYFV